MNKQIIYEFSKEEADHIVNFLDYALNVKGDESLGWLEGEREAVDQFCGNLWDMINPFKEEKNNDQNTAIRGTRPDDS